MAEIAYIKLSELNKKIEDVIKGAFSDTYWIVAEVSGHTFYADNPRHYLTLVEKLEGSNVETAKVQTQAWREGSQAIKYFEESTGQKFQNGLQVLVKVQVRFHSVHGLALSIIDIDQAFTLGNIEKQRRETLKKLELENTDSIKKIGEEYHTKNKSAKLNSVIQNIALVGSPNSAGYNDFTHTISSNQFKYKFSIDVFQSSVQGADAEKELVNRLIAIYQNSKKYDCVVIIRGGGAQTDFMVFDTYSLARAVARFPIPVITGIGHHKDVSIVDMMSHTHTKTPTKAAEFIISHNRQFEDSIIVLQKALTIKSQQMLANAIQKINATNLIVVNQTRTSLARQKENVTQQNIIIINKTRTIINRYKETLGNFNHSVINYSKSILFQRQTALVNLLNNISSRPKIITGNKQHDLSNIIDNLKLFSGKYFQNQHGYVGHYEEMIKLMRPENILKKGFAIVKRKGNIVKSAESINAGEELTITMDTYDINTKVISKTPTNG